MWVYEVSMSHMHFAQQHLGPERRVVFDIAFGILMMYEHSEKRRAQYMS